MYLLPKIFKEEELCLLDAEDEDIDRLVAYYERRENLSKVIVDDGDGELDETRDSGSARIGDYEAQSTSDVEDA
jgi:hypothetical protein